MATNMPASVGALIECWANRTPDAIAIGAPGRAPLTYLRLLNQVKGVVLQLNRFGLGRNDRVALLAPNGPEMAVSFLALTAGATCVPLSSAWRAHEYGPYLASTKARALVMQGGIDSPASAAARAAGIPVIELDPCPDQPAGIFRLTGPSVSAVGKAGAESQGFAQPDDVALLLPTSGTTARPKIVPLTQANICHSAHNIAAGFSLSPRDRCLNIMPLFHIHGLIGGALSSIAAGASVFCTPGFYAPRFLQWLHESQATWYTAVPTMHQAILARPEIQVKGPDSHSLRFIRACSSPLAPRVMAELEEVFGVPAVESYGMTEGSHQITTNPLPPRSRTPGSVGLPTGVELAIADEAGRHLAAGATGEIVIRGNAVTAGYESNPEANRNAFSRGWFRTGDQGYLNQDGYLFITGRLKELINRGGAKISPREVEEALLDHPAVAQAIAFAIPDSRLGEDVGAAVVLKPGSASTEAELRSHAALRLADAKVPRRIVTASELPMGPSGKLQRKGLAEKLGLVESDATQPTNPTSSQPLTPTEKLLAEEWTKVLGIASVGANDDFFRSGGDSMLAGQLIARIYETTGVQLSWTDVCSSPTVRGQAELVAGTRDLNLERACLIPVKASGSDRPFFFIPPAAQLPSGFRDLAILVGANRPFYALTPYPMLKDGARYDICAAAERYAEEIKTVQPVGPYLLGGHCAGGFPSLALARLLISRGEKVALLLVVNPVVPGPHHATAAARWHAFLELPFSEKTAWLRERASHASSVLEARFRATANRAAMHGSASSDKANRPTPTASRQMRINEDVHETNRGAWSTQLREEFTGKVDLWLAEGCLYPGIPLESDPRVPWVRVASKGIDVRFVPGDHISVLNSPNVEVIGEMLRCELDQVDRALRSEHSPVAVG